MNILLWPVVLNKLDQQPAAGGRPVCCAAVSVQVRPSDDEYAGLILVYSKSARMYAGHFDICIRPCLLSINTGTDVDQ